MYQEPKIIIVWLSYDDVIRTSESEFSDDNVDNDDGWT